MRRFAAVVLSIVLLSFCLNAQQRQKIWERGGQGRGQVYLTSYIPDSDTATPAVIVCPGGSYFWHDVQTEGHKVAQWLCQHGIAAFVLEYRVAGKVSFVFETRLLYGGNRFPKMLADLHRSIQLIRENADMYNVRADQLGVMGFSAGGHLAMLGAEYYGPGYLEAEGYNPQLSLKPDFVAPIYPVVTFLDKELCHTRSRRALFGAAISRKDNEKLSAMLSLEANVPDDCCPVYQLVCKDDRTVDYRNSVLLDSALTAKGINHSFLCLESGGHGFGYRQAGEESFDWMNHFLDWLDGVL